MPCLRQSVSTFSPASASLSTPTICSSVNRLFRISPPSRGRLCQIKWPRSRGSGQPTRTVARPAVPTAKAAAVASDHGRAIQNLKRDKEAASTVFAWTATIPGANEPGGHDALREDAEGGRRKHDAEHPGGASVPNPSHEDTSRLKQPPYHELIRAASRSRRATGGPLGDCSPPGV